MPSIFIPKTPQWKAVPGIGTQTLVQLIPDENAAWRDGDILTTGVTGTITSPAPVGSLSTAIGPVLGTNLTVSYSASANKPAQDYFGVVNYSDAGNTIQSQTSDEFIISAPFGFVPTVTVTTVGAPALATNFRTYLGVIPNVYSFQGTTTLGSTFTGANPLTNHTGTVRAATGASTNLVGMAASDSDVFFAGFPGTSAQTGKRSLFGSSQAMAPGWDNDAFALPVCKLQVGTFVMNLLQPYYPTLNGTTAGIAIDTGNTFIVGGTNFFIVDNTQTACLTIIRRVLSNPGVEANGDTGARVEVAFTPAALA